jgi:hypothetical protein
MKRIICFLLLTSILFAGCKEEETPDQEAFIFGQWNLLCEGNCIQIYKFEGGKLYEDNMRSFRDAPVIIYKTPPMDAKYGALAQELENSFPKDYMMPRGLQFIGCPNCVEEGGYYLASVADEIYLNPLGGIDFNGLSSESIFIKGFFEKVGIKPEVFRVGEFKSAVEPFILDKMSDENRIQNNIKMPSL